MGETMHNRDAGSAGLTVQHQPDGHATDCHALSVSTSATSGRGAALSAYSENSAAPVFLGQGPGPLLRLYNAAGTLRFEVANDGTTSVTGATTFTGAVTVDDANFVVLGTNKGYRFRPNGARLDCEATGSDWIFSVFSGTNFDGTQRTYLRLESGVTLAHACGTWIFTDNADSGAVHTLDGTGNKLGFYGASSVAQQTVSGSRASGAAFASLLTKLALVGLIVDGSSA